MSEYAIDIVQRIKTTSSLLSLKINSNISMMNVLKNDLDQLNFMNFSAFEIILKSTQLEESKYANLFNILSEKYDGKSLTIMFNDKKWIYLISRLGMIKAIEKEFEYLKLTLHVNQVTDAMIENNIKILTGYMNNTIFMDREDIDYLLKLNDEINNKLLEVESSFKAKEKELELLHMKLESESFIKNSDEYKELYSKYQDALKRLNNLRNSRFGKLQIKYWDLRK